MQIIADLQIHSKYSRAVSKEMEIPKIWEWAKRKGIDLMATGDWTHPLWMREIKANLNEMGNGILMLKKGSIPFALEDKGVNVEKGPYFLLATEVSSIYSQGGKLRRIHNLIWSPTLESAEKIVKELLQRGANLHSDGRPIVGITSMQIAEIVFSIDPTCLLIPAHAWTPWFSLFGSESGFDSISECFGSYAENIYAIETGLSSDPSMNWRIKELDNRSILSFSDAHSGPKLGREATVFDLKELSFKAIREAIITNYESRITNQESRIKKQGIEVSNYQQPTTNNQQLNKIVYTIEFHPEEGKYHYTGHRNCGVRQTPEETTKKGMICPVCGKKLTIGVMHRVEQLAGRTEKDLKLSAISYQLSDKTSIKMMKSEAFPNRPPYVSLVPLQEILAESFGANVTTKGVQAEYRKLTDELGSEFEVLLRKTLMEIENMSGAKTAEAISKVRTGDIVVDPGYDGVFGVVKIWKDEKESNVKIEKKEQLTII
jgi:PHP family Zn ribbon phosphoesterase